MRFVDVKTKFTNYSVVPNDLYGIGISSTALVLYAKLLNRTNLCKKSLSHIRKEGMRLSNYEIPYWKKYTLSIEEAAAYFRSIIISEKRLKFWMNGAMIKKKLPFW